MFIFHSWTTQWIRRHGTARRCVPHAYATYCKPTSGFGAFVRRRLVTLIFPVPGYPWKWSVSKQRSGPVEDDVSPTTTL